MVRVADAAAVMAIAVVVMGSLRARVMGATQPHRSSEWLRAGRSICPLLRLCCVLRARVYVCESVVPCACEGAFAASVPRACRRAPVLLCFVRACHCAAGRACGYWLGWGRCCLLERFRASNVQFSFRCLLCNREKEFNFDGLARFAQASRDHKHRRVMSGRVDRCPPYVWPADDPHSISYPGRWIGARYSHFVRAEGGAG